jgi:hypothetical protein
MVRRGILLTAAVVALCFVSTASAAGPPTVEQFRFTGVDAEFSAELTEACGFPITVNADAHETHIFFSDGSEQDVIHYSATFVVSGRTQLVEDDNFRILFNTSGLFVSGQDFRLLAPDGTTLLKNRGNFSATDSGFTLHGPHPSFTAGLGYCDFLTYRFERRGV